MSFSFTASGTPAEAIATVGQEAAVSACPQEFADAINNQLSGLPADASVSISCYGHVGWGTAQTQGEIGLHATINVTAANHPSAEPAE
jgi:S-adenosylhomocysteine hydrolase